MSWRVADPASARVLLDDAEVYGVLDLDPARGPVVLVSGAVNPSGTQVAQQVLTTAGQALATGLAQQTGVDRRPLARATFARSRGAARAAARTVRLTTVRKRLMLEAQARDLPLHAFDRLIGAGAT